MIDLFGKKRIAELEQANANLNRRLQRWEDSWGKDYGFMKSQIIAANRGLGRLIAKLDPHYATDELDPSRKAESDRIGAEVMQKLIGEHLASKAPE